VSADVAVALNVALDVLTARTRPATAFFDALTQADKAIELTERLDWIASFAPTPIMYGGCPCGSEFEVRREPIRLNDDERSAVADALGGLDVGDIVAGAINGSRDSEDHQAFADWYDAHADCENTL
jgi:hypothetical protein